MNYGQHHERHLRLQADRLRRLVDMASLAASERKLELLLRMTKEQADRWLQTIHEGRPETDHRLYVVEKRHVAQLEALYTQAQADSSRWFYATLLRYVSPPEVLNTTARDPGDDDIVRTWEHFGMLTIEKLAGRERAKLR